MPGWIFVSALLLVLAVVAGVVGLPTPWVYLLGASAIISLIAGAIVRPDRRS